MCNRYALNKKQERFILQEYETLDLYFMERFNVSGPDNANGILEATTNLTSPVWVPVITNTVPFTYTETNAYAERFYRAISQ